MSRSEESITRVLDLRTYRLVPGKRDDFDHIFREGALPMLHRFGIEVVGHGPSLEDDDHYYVMRGFPSASRREEQLDSFYGSDEWRQNHRDAVLELIETYHTIVIELTPGTSSPSAASAAACSFARTWVSPIVLQSTELS